MLFHGPIQPLRIGWSEIRGTWWNLYLCYSWSGLTLQLTAQCCQQQHGKDWSLAGHPESNGLLDSQQRQTAGLFRRTNFREQTVLSENKLQGRVGWCWHSEPWRQQKPLTSGVSVRWPPLFLKRYLAPTPEMPLQDFLIRLWRSWQELR